jgi:hypothetical protein
MEILYCDGCGFRITEQDLVEGKAQRVGEDKFCIKCRPKEQTAKPSRSKILLSDKPPAKSDKKGSGIHVAPRTGSGIHPAPRPSAAVHISAHPATQRSTSAGNNAAAIYGLMAFGVVAVLIGIVALMQSGSKSTPTSGGHSNKSPTTEARQNKVVDPARHGPDASREKSSAIARGSKPPDNIDNPVASVSEVDSEATARAEFDQLIKFEGLAEKDFDGRVNKLKAFTEKYKTLTVTERAKSMIAEIDAKRNYTGEDGSWLKLGSFTLKSDTLVVMLKDNSNKFIVVADAVRIKGGGQVITIDDSEPGFKRVDGYWKHYSSGGFKGKVLCTHPPFTVGSATFTFSKLTPGTTYEVSATWTSGAHRGAEVPFIFQDDTTVVGMVTVDQTVEPHESKAVSQPIENASKETLPSR